MFEHAMQVLGPKTGLVSSKNLPGTLLAYVLTQLRCITGWLLQRRDQGKPSLVLSSRSEEELQSDGEEEHLSPLTG